MSIQSSSRRAAAGRPTLALGIALALLIGLFAPIVISPRSAHAADAVTTTDLNLRSGPGLDRHVKLVMPPGAPVDLLSGLGNLGFYKVAYQGVAGYAWGEFIEVGGSAGGGRDEDAESDPGSGDAGTAYTTTDLNLRSGPSLASGVILVMPPAAEVTLTGSEENGFAGVAYGGTRGWASTQYLSSSVQAAPETPAEPALPAGTAGGDIVSIIYAAAAAYGQDGNAMLAVAQCESGLNPGAYNASSAASGLFQFLPGTWATTPYAGSNIFDPVASANAAAWMWSVGRRGEWVC